MRPLTLALLAGAFVAAAESTVTLFLPGFDVQSIEGKILGSTGQMTTYLLNCPAGEDPSKCGLPSDGYAITEGASSLEMGYSYGAETVSQYCKIQGTTHADCVATVTMHGSTSAMTTGFSIDTIPYGGFMPVHITATETGGVSVSVSTGSSVSASTATATDVTILTGTVESTGSSTTTAADKTGSSNAALPQVTGKASWVVGGAAVLALAVV